MFDIAPSEPISAARVAVWGSTVGEDATVGICVDVSVGEGARVVVTSGALVTATGGGSVGMGVWVTGNACETSPQARDNITIDNGKNLPTFNI
jgi:hypothetical protein